MSRTMMRPFVVLVTLGLLAASLAACDLGKNSRGGDLSYVAIGDSYTAAPGIGPVDGADTCFRSKNNYPHQVAEEADLDLTDVSCSGASSFAVRSAQTTPQGATIAPQLDAVEADTDIVTVGIGANDFNLIGRILLNCVQLAATDPTGRPCTEVDATSGALSIANRLTEVRAHIEAVIDDVREKAPGAQVLVIGYPEIFPEDDVCELLPLAPGDLPLARQVVDGLNESAEAAARSRDVEFLDVFSATRGHHICGEDPWAAGATTVEGRAGTPWHPYVEEQEAVAELVLAAID